jgi:rod shape-determining protein MreC
LAQNRPQGEDYLAPLRQLLAGLIVLFLIVIFIIWRVDSPRVERFRVMLIDRFLPSSEWIMAPLTRTVNVIQDFQSYQSLYDQNQQLRRELQQMKSWKEAALQLEQENARLLDLNKLQLDAQLTWISGIVRADSGSPFRQSVLLNVGGQDGIQNGWAAMDGLGLVGRIAGVGEKTSRVILLTDPYSQIPAVIQPSRENALVVGDNTSDPLVDFIDNADLVRAGDRIVTSGNGGVLPPGLLIGQLVVDPNGRLRARLSADYERLEYLRVLRDYSVIEITDPQNVLVSFDDIQSENPQEQKDE